MPEITEGRLVFRFPDDWTVVKYDDARGFAVRRVMIDGTKKVDILALSPAPQARLLIIEVKDFRDHAIENRDRMALDGSDPLHIEVAMKVRDTMAILVAAYRARDERLAPVCSHLFGGADRPVDVILFLEEDEPRVRTARGYRDRSNIQQSLKGILRPYGFRCHVQRRRTLPADSPWSVSGVRDSATSECLL
jgi:hypothetical protein